MVATPMTAEALRMFLLRVDGAAPVIIQVDGLESPATVTAVVGLAGTTDRVIIGESR